MAVNETQYYHLTTYNDPHDKLRVIQAEHSLNTDLTTIDRVLHDHAASLAVAFDEHRDYKIGEFCLHNDVVYRKTYIDISHYPRNTQGEARPFIAGEWTSSTLQELVEKYIENIPQADANSPYKFIGRKAECGGIVIFDRLLGFKGDVTVNAENDIYRIEDFQSAYSIDSITGVVKRDPTYDPTYSELNRHRFLVMADFDIGDAAAPLDSIPSAQMAVMCMNACNDGFNFGLENTDRCLSAAVSLLGRNTSNKTYIWQHINDFNVPRQSATRGDQNVPVWFLPSKDEMNVLMNMQGDDATKRKGYNEDTHDWDIQIPKLPILLWPYYYISKFYSMPLLGNGFGEYIADMRKNEFVLHYAQASNDPTTYAPKMRLMRWL